MHAHPGQARQVLAGCVQNPLDSAQGFIDDLQVRKCFGVDEPCACPFPADLHQHGALAIAEAGCAFSIHGGRAAAGGKRGRTPFEGRLGFNDGGDPVLGHVQLHLLAVNDDGCQRGGGHVGGGTR